MKLPAIEIQRVNYGIDFLGSSKLLVKLNLVVRVELKSQARATMKQIFARAYVIQFGT